MSSPKVSPAGSARWPRRLIGALAVPMAVAALAPATEAQAPGVVYEPGSPSDKEYAIPLEEVRRDAGGASPGKAEAAAFGIGISRGGRRGGEGRSSGVKEKASESATGKAGDTAPAGGAQAGDFGQRLEDAEDAAAPAVWKLVPLLIVLLPALLVGLLLARRNSGEQRPAT